VGALQLITSAVAHPAGERVRYAYRVRLIGTDSSGVAFEDEVRTELVTRDGALVVSSRSLAGDAVVFMRRESKVMQARVLGQVGLRQDEYLYGMVFCGSYVAGFWDVTFPEKPTRKRQRQLECSRCLRQDGLKLAEVEEVVFESMHGLSRRCINCGHETLWVEPAIPGEAELVTGSASYRFDPLTVGRPATNRRKHARIAMKNVKACIHREGFTEDVVTVLDMSRGGIRFLSLVDYRPGADVTVSVPFTPGGSNVFSKAKVVRVQTRPRDGMLGEFGLQYVT
jgi:hypothetical protein